MGYWQTPGVSYVQAEDVFSKPASLFLSSLQAGAEMTLRKRQQAAQEAQLAAQQEQFERQMADKLADNERAERQMAQTADLQREQMKQSADLAGQRLTHEKETDRLKGAVDVEKQFSTDMEAGAGPTRAQRLASIYGLSMRPMEVPVPEAPAAPLVPLYGPGKLMQPRPVEPPPLGSPPQPEVPEQPLPALTGPPPVETPPPPAATLPRGFVMDVNGRTVEMPAMAPGANASAMRERAAALVKPILESLAPWATAGDPEIVKIKQRALADVAAMASSGDMPLDKGTITKAVLERAQHLEDQANTNMRTRMNASRAGQPKPVSPSQKADDARADMNTFLSNSGYKLDIASGRQFDRMLNQAELAAKGNPSAARVFMGMFTKFAQGEVGVLTPGDIDTFWTKAGSPVDRTEEMLAQMINGNLGEQKRKYAVSAIQGLIAVAKQRKQGLYDGAVEMMRPHGENGERYLKAYFGKGFPTAREQKVKALSDEADALLGEP